MRDHSPQQLWETALGQLELQVTRPNFDTWLRSTVGLRLDQDQLVVGVPTDFALEWLRSRMSAPINHTVSQLFGSPISVAFQVLGAQPPGTPANGRVPIPASAPPSGLDPRLTFETFTAVPSNRMAYRAARKVAAGEPGYSPLVIFGQPGLGKTHLLHAIGHAAGAAGRHVLALTGEAFVDRYGKAVRAGQPQAFRDSFTGCELLLVDDLLFLASRTASQEQFFHLFNSLHPVGCHFAVTLDLHLDQASGLSQRLRSRLQAGLSVALAPPSAPERLEILRGRAARLSRNLPDDVLHLIAEQPCETVRELEGVLNRVLAYDDLSGTPLTVRSAQDALHPLDHPIRRPTPEAVLRAVSKHFHISRDQLTGASRARDITYARHIAMYLLRTHHQQPLADIGRLLGGRDHSTVLNACRRIENERASLQDTQRDLNDLESSLRSA